MLLVVVGFIVSIIRIMEATVVIVIAINIIIEFRTVAITIVIINLSIIIIIQIIGDGCIGLSVRIEQLYFLN